jgi:phage-related protein
MKVAIFLGDTRQVLRGFPEDVRRELGYDVDRVQNGKEPRNWKLLSAVGSGVKEIRVQDKNGAYRVAFTANFADAVYILHVFQKKTQKTPARDTEIASIRFRQLMVKR